jgi:hypothetical protein
MADAKPHRWQFAARFRRNAFGWRSQPALERVHEAVVEIRKMARRDPLSAGDGAVLFIDYPENVALTKMLGEITNPF